MALVPFASQELALATVAAQRAGDLSLVLRSVSGLREMVRMQAFASGLKGIAHAVHSLVETYRSHTNDISRLKSALTGAVKSFWSNDISRKPTAAQQANHAQALVSVTRQLKPLPPYKGVSSSLVAKQPIEKALVSSALAPLVRLPGPVSAVRVPRTPSAIADAIDFHLLAKAKRQKLVGIELNPGPRGHNQLALRAGVAAAYGNRIVTTNPRITMSKGGRSTRIRHRELLDASIPGSTDFAVQNVIPLNPGLAETFAWLAPQALQWEQYIAHAVRLIYIPIAPTSTQGTISISPSYDPSDPEPVNEQQLSNAVDTVETSVWQNTTVSLNSRAMMTPGPRKFVRGALTAGDVKTFDAGVVYIATNNCTGDAPIGKLWIEYDFEFFVPQNSPNVGLSPSKTAFYERQTNQPLTTTVSTPVVWSPTSDGQDPFSIGYDAATNYFYLPKGFWKISGECESIVTGSAGVAVSGTYQYQRSGDLNPTSIGGATSITDSSGTSRMRVPFTQFLAVNGTEGVRFNALFTAAGVTINLSRRIIWFEIA